MRSCVCYGTTADTCCLIPLPAAAADSERVIRANISLNVLVLSISMHFHVSMYIIKET